MYLFPAEILKRPDIIQHQSKYQTQTLGFFGFFVDVFSKFGRLLIKFSKVTTKYKRYLNIGTKKGTDLDIFDNIQQDFFLNSNFLYLYVHKNTLFPTHASALHDPQLFWAQMHVGGRSVINGAFPVQFYFLVENGLLLHMFPAYMW